MTTLCNSSPLGSRQAFQRTLQTWIYERLITLNLASADLRIAAIALVAGALAAAGNAWFETIAARALQGAQFAKSVTAADTMVAAGRR
jgi:hypothetical protein